MTLIKYPGVRAVVMMALKVIMMMRELMMNCNRYLSQRIERDRYLTEKE